MKLIKEITDIFERHPANGEFSENWRYVYPEIEREFIELVNNLKCCANCIHGFHTEMRDHIMINCQAHEKLPAMATAVCDKWEWDGMKHEDRIEQ